MPDITDTPLPVPTPPWKDILIRAGKTFVQGSTGAVGGVIAITEIVKPDGFELEPLTTFGFALLIGGLSAVTSWVWNILVQWANS